MDDIMDAPMVPQPDWLTDEEVDALEQELIKTAAPGVDLKAKREKELQLLQDFKKSPGQDTFMPLYQSYKPLIMKATQKNAYGSPLPPAAHTALAAQSFLDAVRTYNPDKGTAFRTHAHNTVLEKGKRLNLKYQNIGYIPESRATKYQSFQTTNYLLKEELGREPSTLELSDEMGIPPSEVERLRKEIRKDLVGTDTLVRQGPAWAQTDKAMQAARDMMYSLHPKHQLVLEHGLGMNGKTALVKKNGSIDVQAVAKAAGISVNEVRSAQKTISRKFRELRGYIGKDTSIAGAFEDVEE